MASIKDAGRLVKEVSVLNYLSDGKNSLYITALLNGPHGIGKSQVCKQVAEALDTRFFYTMDGSCIKEGEATGLPFAHKNEDGSSEVRFIKYYVFNKIWQLQKYYYEKATTTGFLNGTVKIELDDEGNEYLVITKGTGEDAKVSRQLTRTALEMLEAGEDNKYEFGNQLDGETKLKLLESGEIKPVVILIDELNRTELQTMKELMNIILNKVVNGYRIPWFVSIVSAVNPCSQNSTYATNEMDDAQLDRFLKIRVDANISDWSEYMMFERKISSDVIEALAMDESIFIHREKSQQDTSEMSPSPRSWEMVINIYENLKTVLQTSFFNEEEKKHYKDDLRALIKGKVGETACRELMKLIEDKENHIKPEEIITCKDMKISSELVRKFNGFKALSQLIVANNIVGYIAQNVDNFIAGKKPNAKPEEKTRFACFQAQLGQFTDMLSPATQVVFVKKFLTYPVEGKGNTNNLFTKVASAFSKSVLETLREAKVNISELTNQ